MSEMGTTGTKAARCALCGERRPFRRALCQACYRKLARAGIALPPDGRQARYGGERGRVQRLLARLGPEKRARLDALVRELVIDAIAELASDGVLGATSRAREEGDEMDGAVKARCG